MKTISVQIKNVFTLILVITLTRCGYDEGASALCGYDPRLVVVKNISSSKASAYCLIHIEKGKKFIAKTKEPELPKTLQYDKLSSAEWLKDKRAKIKLIASGSTNKKLKPNDTFGKFTHNSDIQVEAKNDEVFETLKLSNPDKTIFKPDHSTTNGDGWGVIVDCYFGNSNKKVKHQVKYLNCPAKSKKFTIFNYRLDSDGDDGNNKVRWSDDEKISIDLAKFETNPDIYFFGDLSGYADAFMDTEKESSCMIRIKSNVLLTLSTVTLILGLIFLR